jgi:hypothetical protein
VPLRKSRRLINKGTEPGFAGVTMSRNTGHVAPLWTYMFEPLLFATTKLFSMQTSLKVTVIMPIIIEGCIPKKRPEAYFVLRVAAVRRDRACTTSPVATMTQGSRKLAAA